MEYHVACMVVNDGFGVSCCIIYQVVTFGDSVGGWFYFFVEILLRVGGMVGSTYQE